MKPFTKGSLIFAFVLAVLGYFIGNRGSEYARHEYAQGVSIDALVSAFPTGFPVSLAGNPFHLSGDRIDVIAGSTFAVLVLLIWLCRVCGQKTRRLGEEHGSARWARRGEITPFTDKDPSNRLQFTQTEALSLNTRRTGRNLNVLVVGGSGAGKTRHYVLPNLAQIRGMSFAVTDPKGEISRMMQPYFESLGIPTRTLNLIDLKASHGFNPFRYFSETDPETSIVQLVEAIMMNASGSENRGTDFWERAERALMTALIAYTWATQPDSAGGPTLPQVIDLHKTMQGSEENPDAHTSETDMKFLAARQLVKDWQTDPARFDGYDEQVMKVLDFAARQYRVYQQGAAETRMSVIISLGVRLAPFDMHDVRALMTRDELAIDRLGEEPAVLFLQIPDTHTTFRFLAAMFWQSLFEKSIYVADHTPGGHLRVPVHCFLDEFANIGRIPNFEIMISTIRSRGISASVIVQNDPQGKAVWKDHWATIVGNCDTTLFLGGREQQTNEWLSKQMGAQTIGMDEHSQTRGMSGSATTAGRTLKRDLMTADEIGKLDSDHALLLIRGLYPFKSRKVQFRITVPASPRVPA